MLADCGCVSGGQSVRTKHGGAVDEGRDGRTETGLYRGKKIGRRLWLRKVRGKTFVTHAAERQRMCQILVHLFLRVIVQRQCPAFLGKARRDCGTNALRATSDECKVHRRRVRSMPMVSFFSVSAVLTIVTDAHVTRESSNSRSMMASATASTRT